MKDKTLILGTCTLAMALVFVVFPAESLDSTTVMPSGITEMEMDMSTDESSMDMGNSTDSDMGNNTRTEEESNNVTKGNKTCPTAVATFGTCVFNDKINCVDNSNCTDGELCCPSQCNKECMAVV